MWHNVSPNASLGVAHLWKQDAFRFLGTYQFMRETETRPSGHVSVGVQGIGTGNPGYSGTLEKNFKLEGANLNLFGGIGFRSNEDHTHPVAGAKVEFPTHFTAGIQWDGHNHHPFVTQGFDRFVVGFYLINGKSPGYMIGARF